MITPRTYLNGILAALTIPLLIGAYSGLLAKSDAGYASAVALLLLNSAIILFGWSRYRQAMTQAASSAASEQKAQSLAATDALTGFLNRRAANEAISELLKRTGTTAPVALVSIDLDGFRTVNDLHGHLTGDNLLRLAGDVIRRAFPSGTILGRVSGDQFVACFPFRDEENVDSPTAAAIHELGKPIDLTGVELHVSASAGIARSDQQCSTVDALTRRADIALRAAKANGRGRAVWFDASMQREFQSRNELEAQLRKAIEAGEIVPYFEQQIDLSTGDLEGFEMLARWNHPELGITSPDRFIGIAEECGLIGDLSLSVIAQAMKEARWWDNSLRLSVNISPIQLKDPWLAQKIAKLLAETGFPAERLEVEITESSLLENLSLVQAIVVSLKNLGVQLALDDFGTGYSSLAHLRALPFDRIKIDRSFVMSINENAESAVVVTAVTRLGESLNIEVTAEGVEDAAIQERLRSIGNYCAQGWIFGKPMPVEDVRALLAGKGLLRARREFGLGPVAEQFGSLPKRSSGRS